MVDWKKSLVSSATGVGLAAAALIGVAAPGVAFGADWHLNSGITEEFTYDDNYRLDPSNQQSLWGFNTRPHVGIESHAPRTDLYLNGSLNYGYFPDTTSQNSFDQSADVTLNHRATRDSLGVSANVSHETTRSTEAFDTGTNFTDASRIGTGASGSWSHVLTERMSAGLGASASYVTYDTNALDDYRNFSGGPFISYVLTEKDSVSFSGTYSRYDRLTGLSLTSDYVVGKGTWSHVFTPQLSGSVSGGANYTMTDEDVQNGPSVVSTTSNNVGYDAGATITYTEERASLSGTYTHTVVPSGLGRVQERNSVGLFANYRATPLVSVGFNTSFIQQDSADNTSGGRNFVTAEPSLSWNFLPDWSARIAYRFRTQEQSGEGRAYSNGGVASVSWRLPSWSPGQGK